MMALHVISVILLTLIVLSDVVMLTYFVINERRIRRTDEKRRKELSRPPNPKLRNRYPE